MILLVVGLPRSLRTQIMVRFQVYTVGGLLLAGKWVGQRAEILPDAALKLLSRFTRATTLWPLVLVKDR